MEKVHAPCLLDSGAIEEKRRTLDIQIRVTVACVIGVMFQALLTSTFTFDVLGILKDTVLQQFYNFLFE